MDMAHQFIADSREDPEVLDAARDMLRDAYAMRDRADELLRRHVRHWGLSRLSLVDRNVLRLGVYEMLSGNTPPKVAITEALRLAKEFSSAESPKFVNGILDAVYKQLRSEMGEHDAEGDRRAQA